MRLFWILVLALGLTATPVLAKNHGGKHLPPGLQKKADHGQALPPGWQKKLAKGAILDREVYRQCRRVRPVDDHGVITVRVDGKVIRLIEATREILEVLE